MDAYLGSVSLIGVDWRLIVYVCLFVDYWRLVCLFVCLSHANEVL